MNSVSWVRALVLFGLAVYITFGRSATLPFVYGEYMNWADYILNYGVATLAVLAAIPGFASRVGTSWSIRMFPFAILATWMAFGCSRGDIDVTTWHSEMFNIVVAVYLGSQISRSELPALRRCVLLIAALFTLLTLMYGSDTIELIRTGWLKGRLGTSITASNGVVLPRIMYVFVFTCFVTLIIERWRWFRPSGIILAIIPGMIAFATGGRGPLLAVVLAMGVFLAGLTRGAKLTMAWGLIVAAAAGVAGFFTIVTFFPQFVDRITDAGDTGRMAIWGHALEGVSLIGRGRATMYAHNIFLEFLQDHGVIGLGLFLLFLGLSLKRLWRAYNVSRDREVLWVVGLLVLQLTAQQFSLHMFFPFVWATLALPMGLEVEESEAEAYRRLEAAAWSYRDPSQTYMVGG